MDSQGEPTWLFLKPNTKHGENIMKEYHEVANEQYQSLSSLISRRKKKCNELSKLIDDEYNSLVELYENQIISDLRFFKDSLSRL